MIGLQLAAIQMELMQQRLVGEIVRRERLRQHVRDLESTMQCNCDLDNWQPESDTGHSWVCRIHKAAKGL